MRKIEVNGKMVSTNYGEEGMYAIHSGNPGKTQVLRSMSDSEDYEQFLSRLADAGFKTIRFAQVSTMVRGYHKTIALCRR